MNFLANPKSRCKYNAKQCEVLCISTWGKSDRDLFPLSSPISFFLLLFLNARNIRDTGLIPGSGRSPKEVHVNSNILAWRIPMDRRAWWATVHGVTKSQTWLRDWHFQLRRVRRPEEGALMFCKEWPTGRRKTPLLYWKRLNAVKLLSPDYSPPKFFFSSIRMFFFPWSMGTCT